MERVINVASRRESRADRDRRLAKERIQQMKVKPASKVLDNLYSDLVKDRKVRDLIALVQYCSSKQMTMEETVNAINSTFYGYLKYDKMDVYRFESLLDGYHDVAMAWGYGLMGTHIDLMKVQMKATNIIEGIADNVEDTQKALKSIEMYARLYDKEYLSRLNSKDIDSGGNLNVSIDFNDKDTSGGVYE